MMEPNDSIIAIDPGKSGAIAWRIGRDRTPDVITMPETDGDIRDRFGTLWQSARRFPEAAVVYIEDIPMFTGRIIPSSSFAKLYGNYRYCKAMADAHRFCVLPVSPRTWQARLGLFKPKDMADRDWKNKLKGKAQELWPNNKITLATADALLLLHYGLIHRAGKGKVNHE